MKDSDRISMERFSALADAYGAVVARWPEAVRDKAMCRAREPEFGAVLAKAESLDAYLDAWTVYVPGNDLLARVVSSAPTPRRAFCAGARFWWAGIGIGVSLAGAAAGALGAATFVPPELVASDAITVFGDISGQEA